MHFKNKLFTWQCFVYLIMVAPAAANININTVQKNNGFEYVEIQTEANPSAWVTFAGLHPNADALINAIAASDIHGLNIDRYQLKSLEHELELFVDNSEQSGKYISESNAQQRMRLEQSLNQAFALFSSDLGRGVLDAQKTQKNLHRSAPVVDTDDLLARLRSGNATVRELLAELTPQTPQYKNLVEHMRALLDERDSGITRTKVNFAEGVTIDTSHDLVVDLRARLIETGDLDPYSRLSNFVDYEVAEALKLFQTRHGIEATGELTKSTVTALNASVDDDIEQVAMNLERWRWMPRELGDRHIMVNVPSYNLIMMNNDQRIADMAVVVGSKKHNTPVFSEDAKFVEVAPTWTVPASITNNELIPIERRKPGYLDAENMDFLRWEGKRLKRVPRSQVTAADFQKNPFPYVLQQRAGDDNALGKIKILMPNRFAVYMHDTQSKHLFAKTDRAYSHGCIRLSEPLLLGKLLLQLDGKTEEEAQQILDKKKTTRIKLQDTTPTHISYFTAWVDDEGKLHTRKDIYKHNDRLLSGLYKSNTLLSALKSRQVNALAEQTEL